MRRPDPGLARISNGSIARVSFDAEGCATARAAAAAVAELADGAALFDAGRVGPGEVAATLGGVGPQGRHAVELAADALHRALAAAAGSGLSLAPEPADGERVLVALSGGVDSAVAALRERERGAEVVAVTLKLWADRAPTRRAAAARRPRCSARAHSPISSASRTCTLDLEDVFRAAVVGAFVDGYRAGRTPNPCVICNGELRLDAMLALAGRLGCSRARDRPLRPDRRRRRGPAARRRRRPRQGPDLHALRPAAGLAGAPALPARRAGASRGSASSPPRPASRSPRRPRARTCASSPARASARSSPATAGSASAPGAIVDTAGRRRGTHRGHHEFTVGQRRGLGLGGSRAALRAGDRRRVEQGHGRRRASSSRVSACACAVRRFTGRRPGRPGRACATTRARSPASSATSAPASTRSSSSRSASPPTASPRARRRAC